VTTLRLPADRQEPGRPRRLVRHAIACAVAVLGVPPAALRAQSASEVQVTPETMTLAVGQKQPIFATAFDRQGNLIATAKFTFWSSDTSIAKVTREGTVQGMAAGLAKVEARTQGRRASLAVLITGASAGPGSAGSLLTLEPTTAMLLPGETVRITPQAVHEDGSSTVVGKVTWKSLKPEVATVDSTGMVVAVAPGKSIVQASAPAGLMATLPVEVEQADIVLLGDIDALGPQDAETLSVRVPSQNNREIHAGIQWQSADTSVATVDSTGIVTARAPGHTEIVMHGLGLERRAPLLVHKLPERLVVSPKPATEPLLVPVKSTRQFNAVAEGADSGAIPEVRIVWAVGDSSRAAFDRTTGTLTARDTGATTLTANLHGFEPVVWRVQVVPGIVSLDRTRVGLRLGEHAALTASLRDDDNKVIGPATVQWSSDRPEIAAVSNGDVRGVSPGHAMVSAAAPWGRPVTADVFVTADLLVSSNRSGAFGLYQIRSDSPDTLLPISLDGGATQAVRSPDRTRIAYSSARGGSADIYLADADGRNPRRLTSDPGAETQPAWTPDGSRLVYTATPTGGVAQVMSVKVDGTDPRPLTSSTTGGNTAPDVSPDGRRVAFVSTRDGNPEIYEVTLAGGEARRLTKTGDREANPRYLPGGDLLYVLDKGSKARLMRLAAGSSAAPLPVLEIDQPVVALDVSPDGERVAYVAGKVAQAGKGKSQLSLRIQPLAPRSTPVLVPLHPGEQVLSPSF
jgi:Tol biopolymer transport system component